MAFQPSSNLGAATTQPASISRPEQCMQTSIEGRAWLFVERLGKFVEQFNLKLPESDRGIIQMMPRDDLFFLACDFFKRQEKFHNKGIPCNASMGYHYTNSEYMGTIGVVGLKNHKERQEVGIDHHNGSRFGEGIYVAEEPRTWRSYGDTCILVAILPGKQMIDRDCGRGYQLGNTSILAAGGSAMVLQKASQCLSLVHFKKERLWEEVYNGYAKFRGLKSCFQPASSRRGQVMEQFHSEFAGFLEIELNSKLPKDPLLSPEIVSMSQEHRNDLENSSPSSNHVAQRLAKLQQQRLAKLQQQQMAQRLQQMAQHQQQLMQRRQQEMAQQVARFQQQSNVQATAINVHQLTNPHTSSSGVFSFGNASAAASSSAGFGNGAKSNQLSFGVARSGN